MHLQKAVLFAEWSGQIGLRYSVFRFQTLGSKRVTSTVKSGSAEIQGMHIVKRASILAENLVLIRIYFLMDEHRTKLAQKLVQYAKPRPPPVMGRSEVSQGG